MPDDDSMLGQNLVDERNEARRPENVSAAWARNKRNVRAEAKRKPTRIQKERRFLVLLALGCFFGAMFILVEQAQARPPVPPRIYVAVREHWQTRAERIKAFDVIWCESRYSPRAQNGIYAGLFQLGRAERARYGHGPSASSQARAAYRLYAVAGWRPWGSCA